MKLFRPIAATVLALFLLACSTTPDAESTPAGSPSTHAVIAALDDCGELQHEFDVAMTNVEAREPGDPAREVSFAYAKTALARMEALDCP